MSLIMLEFLIEQSSDYEKSMSRIIEILGSFPGEITEGFDSTFFNKYKLPYLILRKNPEKEISPSNYQIIKNELKKIYSENSLNCLSNAYILSFHLFKLILVRQLNIRYSEEYFYHLQKYEDFLLKNKRGMAFIEELFLIDSEFLRSLIFNFLSKKIKKFMSSSVLENILNDLQYYYIKRKELGSPKERCKFLEKNIKIFNDVLNQYAETINKKELSYNSFLYDITIEKISLLELTRLAEKYSNVNAEEFYFCLAKGIYDLYEKAHYKICGIHIFRKLYGGLLRNASHNNLMLCLELTGASPDLIKKLYFENPELYNLIKESSYEGFLFLKNFPQILNFLKELIFIPKFLKRVFKIFENLGDIIMEDLKKIFEEKFMKWENVERIPSKENLGLEASLKQLIEEIQYYRLLSKKEDIMPTSIKKLFTKKDKITEEYKKLKEMDDEGKLNEENKKRILKLKRTVDGDETIKILDPKNVEKLLKEQLIISKLEALDAIIKESIRSYYAKIYPELSLEVITKDFIFGINLYKNISKKQNKRVLKRLLKGIVQGKDLISIFQKNKEFIEREKKKGINLLPFWLDFSQEFELKGKRYLASIENNPLKALKMGEIFSTCLSLDSDNNYLLVGNVVEINKRVIFLKDSFDKILARKLIAIDNSGNLFGFRTYSFNEIEPWEKIFLDLFCLKLSNKIGLKLADEEAENKFRPQNFYLFTNSYFYSDEIEPFD